MWPTQAALAKIVDLPVTVRTRLESPVRVELLRSTCEVPVAVVQACAAAQRGGEFRLADPGQPYQETDRIALPNRHLPWRRLRWAVRLSPGDYYLLHYEKGGFSHSFHVRLVDATEGEPGAAPARLVWSATIDRVLRNYRQFVAALRAGRLNDDPDLVH